LIKMVMNDFGIHSEKDLEKAVMAIGNHVMDDIESCPYFRRLRVSIERMARYAMKHIKVTDLPTGKRMEWVNQLTHEIYDIMKDENSIERLHDFAGDLIEEFVEETEHWMHDAERYEQTFNKKGGI